MEWIGTESLQINNNKINYLFHSVQRVHFMRMNYTENGTKSQNRSKFTCSQSRMYNQRHSVWTTLVWPPANRTSSPESYTKWLKLNWIPARKKSGATTKTIVKQWHPVYRGYVTIFFVVMNSVWSLVLVEMVRRCSILNKNCFQKIIFHTKVNVCVCMAFLVFRLTTFEWWTRTAEHVKTKDDKNRWQNIVSPKNYEK